MKMKKMMDVMKTLVYTLVDTKTVADELNKEATAEQREREKSQSRINR